MKICLARIGEFGGFGFADEEYSDESSDRKEQNGEEMEKIPMDKFGWFYKVG